jgi:hypothetical protein
MMVNLPSGRLNAGHRGLDLDALGGGFAQGLWPESVMRGNLATRHPDLIALSSMRGWPLNWQPGPVAGEPEQHASPGAEWPPRLGDALDCQLVGELGQLVVVPQMGSQPWFGVDQRIGDAGGPQVHQAGVERAEAGDLSKAGHGFLGWLTRQSGCLEPSF